MGVDYGLLDDTGALIGNPVHYRSAGPPGSSSGCWPSLARAELYAVTGIAELPINTLIQLVSAIGSPALDAARNFLMIPDLLGYWLTGRVGAEVTNASTTQLLDVSTGQWATSVMRRAGLPTGIFPSLRQAGDEIGPLLPQALAGWGCRPARSWSRWPRTIRLRRWSRCLRARPEFCYISCGTWSLVGVELDRPVLTPGESAGPLHQ